jgi:hypothetical protein
LGVHGGHGDSHGIGGVAWPVSAGWGCARGSAEWRKLVGGWQRRWWWKARERERVLAGRQPQAPRLLRVQLKNDKKNFYCHNILGFREGEAMQIFFPPLGRLAKEGKERARERERIMGKARVHLAKFKFKFEFLQTRFENLLKIVSRGLKHG